MNTRLWPRLLAILTSVLTILGIFLAGRFRTTNPEGTTQAEVDGSFFFEDVTEKSGIRAYYRNGEEAGHFTMLETLGGGVALIDYDRDGLLDVFFPGGGYFDGTNIRGFPSKLYKNLGNFRFEDVTAKVLGEQPLFYTHGAAVADYDRDGWPDLVVTGWGRLALYHNVPTQDGKGRRFVEVADSARLPRGLWTTSAAWGDLDGDGYPDLYLCQYVDWSMPGNHPQDCSYDGRTRDICPPKKFKGLPHKLFRNNGDGTFTDVSKEAGLRLDGRGLGVVIVDFNRDGKPDVYVANDTEDNFLYLNRSGAGKMVLEEKGWSTGVARDGGGSSTGSMGVDAADFNGSGRASIWVTNYENEVHSLYQNDCSGGHEHFTYCSSQAGVAAIGRSHVGWGTGFLDVDHHGWEDLLIVHGHTLKLPNDPSRRRQRPVLLRNAGGQFHDAGAAAGPYFREPHNGRGAALGDLDNDGQVDLVISHLNEPAVVLRNVSHSGNHWLGVKLAGKGYRDSVGACVTVQVGGRQRTLFAKGGSSYASSSDRRLVFGLGQGTEVERLEVTWPGGQKESWNGLEVDRYWRLEEGNKVAVRLDSR
jgi:hypothetical protein